MKRITALVLAGLCVLSLCACQKKAEEETTAAEAATEAATEAAAEGTTDIDTINKIVSELSVVEPGVMGTVEKLGQYTGLEITALPHVEITMEEAVDYINNSIMPNFLEEVPDAIVNGDVANIDYVGKKDGVAFDGGTAEGYDLVIGSGSFIDGFESGLLGHKAGETVDLDLTFPETYAAENLAGQAVVFTVKINAVKRQAELTDEIAAEINPECKTVEDLKKLAREALQDTQDLNEKQELYLKAIQQVLDGSEIVPGEEAIEYTTNKYITSYAESMQAYGIDLGTLLSYYGSTYEDFRNTYREMAVTNVEQRTVLEEIAKKENLKVTDADIAAFAEDYGYSVESIKEVLTEKELDQLVLEDLANQFIVDHATVTYEEAAE